jgi:predicted RecB family nuclease
MRVGDKTIEISASDLSHFLGCRHRTGLDLAVARGMLKAPSWVDPIVAILQQRGLEHERSYADSLRDEGLKTIDLADRFGDDAVGASVDAMRSGLDVILQPALRVGKWFGRPDILRRVEGSSNFGAWSFEVFDTKLAKETRGGTVLQLALYSDLLGAIQGTQPEFFSVVTPDLDDHVQMYRTADFSAYFRLIRAQLDATTGLEPKAITDANYPERVDHCDVCRWWQICDKRRHDDDHLSLVAGISHLQIRELQRAGVNTLAEFASLPLPLPFKPRRGAVETYENTHEQARVQLKSRRSGTPYHELLPIEQGQGLARLPEPSPGDIFLDLEGDPFARDGGREYLFGLVSTSAKGAVKYRSFWAHNDAEERDAFESVIDLILKSWKTHPTMHVYHYAPYEPSALKRLMGRHATREEEMDRMLRAGRFVDLYAVVKHSLRASVERYSIKDLELFFSFTRSVELATAGTHRRVVERALEFNAPDAITSEDREAVEGYNRDDCVSALRLREWLEHLRETVESNGTVVPRPESGDGEPSDALSEREQQVRALMAKLTQDVPTEVDERTSDQQARWLLANLIEWHRREEKTAWWEFFHLRELSEDELIDERAAISKLGFVKRLEQGKRKTPVDRYSFPLQDTGLGDGDELYIPPEGARFGSVAGIDIVRRTLDIKKRKDQVDAHPKAVFTRSIVDSKVLAASLTRIAEDVIERGIEADGRYSAARELLRGKPPRLSSGAFAIGDGKDPVEFAVRIGPKLNQTILAIQGPPGSGKTYVGAEMICELARRGPRVGVTAVSHKVIRNLLNKVTEAAKKKKQKIRCAEKVAEEEEEPTVIKETTDNDELFTWLRGREIEVAGGTAWLWAREEAEKALDVLFIDEAGQMSLANVLAVSPAAKSIVLLGDPQQLEQPQQGSHPEGTDVSALDHILGRHQTIPKERGIFLSETWRLAPSICTFTSELFYEGRLRSRENLERQKLVGTGPFDRAGLWVIRAEHEGNQNSSPEEVKIVERIVSVLLKPGAKWINSKGVAQALKPSDILVVSPYNAQVSLLGEKLRSRGISVGTVDKFQGQEAPVVIYSMATSQPEDAPRRMEFLYSLNRLNVATSRARCACIIVGSPRLFEPECKSPGQMHLANALCRYAELASVAKVP